VLSRWRWFVDYAGPGNRIWIAWNDEFIDVEFLNVGSQFVHCRVLIHELDETILITVVYGANEVSARRELWQGLIELAVTVDNVPWLVGGDFNAVLDMSEVSGASGDILVAMNEFNDCILQTGLLSMPMQGERFTWHNCSLDGRSLWKRLDRLLVNDIWMDRWPNLFYTCLTPRTSDHSPLVLKGDCRNMQVSLFRFDNYLALSPGFLASVQSIWRHPVIGTPMYSVTRKLKALKSVFWKQRSSKGDLAMNVKLAAGFLEVAQNILQFDRHNSLLLLLEHCCRLVYLKASKLEQVMLRQRAKLQWLKGGDQCSKVFFRRVATRRANKRIFQISDDDGNEQTEPTIISSIFVDFFQGLLGGDRTDRAIDLRYLRPSAQHILTDDEAWAIIRPVTIDEVKTAFFDIEEDKALDQMDFPRVSLKLPGRLWIIVSRIREILDLLISPSQNAFVPGRLISDNILLAQELFSGYNQCRLPPRCALKVDLRKAYNTVEWDFLITTLRLFGFPAVFIRWIEECVTSAHYSVVVNGRSSSGQISWPTLISARLSVADCQPLLQKIDSRIKGWEGVQLSFAGRVQLIKSVLISFEVYRAAAFILPKGIINEMIKRLRTFLWKGTSSSGYPKVAWEAVCRPIEEGGLGIKDIFALNRALMSKHLWAVIKQNRTSIWVDWIIQIRLRDCSIWTVKDNKGAWGWRKMLSLRHSFVSQIHFCVGNGDSISL
ncbi:hypothetical protein Sango_3082900, partial [Sesamum angolense]